MLKLTDIHKAFNGNPVLKGIDITVAKGDVVVILGPSGSGKTTLLRCINFLEQATSGEMFFDDLFVTVITVLSKVQHMRPSAACHDISVMVQEVHVEVLVLVDSHRHLQLLVGLFIERKRTFRRKI